MVDRVGQHLGNYRLTQLLGRGGFAEVYLGEHQRLKTLAAIKVLHTTLDEADVEHFLAEARTIARLEHPHIIRVLDFDVAENITPFLVMSYAPNGNLRQRHPRGTPLPLTTVVDYIKQVADGLQYAHGEKLIHRDIKPENMLIGKNGEILLSDFGIALIAQSSHIQSTQDVVGTVHYMAPEQIQGKPRLASDQYSLGIIVYEWLSGTRPFNGSFTEIATQHMFVPPPPLREKVPSLSPEVEQVINIALAKDPHQRFGSIQAFATAFEQASHSLPSPLSETVIPTWPASRSTASTQEQLTPQIPPPPPDIIPVSTPIQSTVTPSQLPGTDTPPPGAGGTSIVPGEMDPSTKKILGYILDAIIVLVMPFILFTGAVPELAEVPNATNDITRYQCYASLFLKGTEGLSYPLTYQCSSLVNTSSPLPLHTLPQEYPFLSVILFALNLAGPATLYQINFAIFMAITAIVIYFVLKRWGSLQAALAFILYLLIGAWGTAEGRYDLVPCALTLGAAILATRSRWNWAFALLAIATLLKVYPIILVPIFIIAQQKQYEGPLMTWQRWKGFSLFIGICIFVTLLSLLVSVKGTLSPLNYFLERPVQVESLPASLLWLGQTLGPPLRLDVSYGSFNFLSDASQAVTTIFLALLIAGIIYVCWLQLRNKIDIFEGCLLMLLLVLITGKVFSSQYLIWVLPFAAYIGKFRWKWLVIWGAIALLTTCIFPFLYNYNIITFYPVVLLRNALLLTITTLLLYKARRTQAGTLATAF